MENNQLFEKSKEVLKSLEGFNYFQCKTILEGIIKRLEYRKNMNTFTYEEPEIL